MLNKIKQTQRKTMNTNFFFVAKTCFWPQKIHWYPFYSQTLTTHNNSGMLIWSCIEWDDVDCIMPNWSSLQTIDLHACRMKPSFLACNRLAAPQSEKIQRWTCSLRWRSGDRVRALVVTLSILCWQDGDRGWFLQQQARHLVAIGKAASMQCQAQMVQMRSKQLSVT